MSEYADIFDREIEKYRKLVSERSRIQAQVAGIRDFLKAALVLMPEPERAQCAAKLESMTAQDESRNLNLTAAIQALLESHPDTWYKPTTVRDRLMEAGFNFSEYTSNPLASVHTVLKRFPSTLVKTQKHGKGRKDRTLYCWKAQPGGQKNGPAS